jgi:autotransporter-associated beta strand protein
MAAYYFDLNGATAGFGTLTGNWDNGTTADWSTSSAGTSATAAVTFTNADTANFGFAGTTATAGTATITTGNIITVNQLVTANLAGGAQTIAAAGTGALTLAGTTPTINVGSAGGLTISAPISGTSGFTKAGTGQLNLPTASTGLSGTVTISDGQVVFGNSTNTVTSNIFPNASVSIASGKTLYLLGNAAYTNTTVFSGLGKIQMASGGLGGAGINFGPGTLSGMTGTTAPSGAAGSTLGTAGLEVYSTNSPPIYNNPIVTLQDMPSTLNFISNQTAATALSITAYYTGTPPVGGYPTKIYPVVTGNGFVASLTTRFYANQSLANGALVLTGGIQRTTDNTGTFNLYLQGTNTLNNTISGNIIDPGTTYALAITKADGGKWVFSGTNTYTGNTRTSAGELSITNSLALQNSPLDLNTADTGTLTFSGAAATAATIGGFTTSGTAKDFAIPAGLALTLKPVTGTSFTYAGVLSSGAGATFTKDGPGTQILTGTNTVTGTVTVTGGTLTAGANGTTGNFGAAANNIVVGTGATASVNRSNAYQIDGSITGAGTFSTVTGAGTLTLTNSIISVSTLTHSAGTVVFPTAGQTVSSAIGGAGAITISAPGTVTFSGAGANTGAWAVNAGATLNVTAAQLGATGAITVASGATLTTSANVSKPITVSAGGTATITGDTGALGAYGTVVLNNGTTPGSGSVFGSAGNTALLTVAGTRNLSSSGSNAALEFNLTTGKMAIYQTGGTITNTGTNTAVLGFGRNAAPYSSTAYTYYRGTGGTINASRYLLAGWLNNDVAGASDVVLDFAGVTATTPFTCYFGMNNCTVNVTAGSFASSGTGGFVIGGPAAAANTERIFTIDASASPASVSVTNTAAASGINANTGNDYINLVQDGAFSVAGLVFPNTSTKYFNIWGGKLTTTGTIAASAAGTMSFRLFNRPGYANRLSASTTTTGIIDQPITEATGYGISSLAYTQGAGYIGPPFIKISGGSGTGASARAVWSADGTISSIIVTSPGSGYLAGDTVTFTATNGLPVSGGTAIVPGTVTLAANTVGVGFTKDDSGTLTLTGTNTYTGTTSVSAGTLRIGNAGAAGTLGNSDAGAAAISSGATLAFNRNDARTYSGTISGAGTINVTGGARATVSGTNTFTSAAAAIALSTTGSILRLTNSDSIGQGTSFGITVPTGTALELDGTSGNLTGLPAKALSLSGAGVSSTGALRNIAGNNTYSGAVALAATTTIGSDSGTLSLTSASAITGTFALSFVGAGDVDVSQAINISTGTVTKTTGAGAAILRGTSSYTGATTATTGYLGYTGNIAASTNGNFGNSAAGVNIAESAGLRYYGSGTSTFSRGSVFNGATVGATYKLESNGSGSVTHSVAPSFQSANVAKTLQLGGTGTASNTISYVLANNGTGAVTLTKADAGKWVLTNTSNSYTGSTTVTGGTLVLSVATWAANAKVTGTGSVSVSAGAKIQTLAGSGGSAQLGRHTYPSLTFAANSRIRIGG